MSALISKEVEIQRLKKIYIMVIMLGSIAASVEVDRDSALHSSLVVVQSLYRSPIRMGDLWQCTTEECLF